MKSTKLNLKRSLLAATLIIGQTLTPLAVLAADNEVRLAGQVVLSNISGVSGMPADLRAEKIQQNLDNALVAAKDLAPSAVAVTYTKGTPILTLSGYQVATVDAASAKAAHLSPALLAKKWADDLRNALRDQASVEAYVSQLSGSYQTNAPSLISSAPAPVQQNVQQAMYNNSPVQQANYEPSNNFVPPARQGRIVFAPAGLNIPATLTTSVSSEVARPGDIVQANISQAVILGDSQIPTGSVLLGQVVDGNAGKMLGRSGAVEIKFNRLRTPDGQEVPLTAHLVGGIGKYQDSGNDRGDTFHGETWKGKVAQGAVRGLIGAGTGAALGTAVGAIAGGKRGIGRGAWSGTAIGGGVGLAQSLILRKGANVNIASGTPINLQLDAPLQFAGSPSTQINVFGSTY